MAGLQRHTDGRESYILRNALAELHAVCSAGPSAAALLRRQSTPASRATGSVSPLSVSGEVDSELIVRRVTPQRALVPRPRPAATLEHMAAKYGLVPSSTSPGAKEREQKERETGELAALREDRQVLLSLYQRLVAEHAEVCLAYDAAVGRARAQGLTLPDLAAVKARAPN